MCRLSFADVLFVVCSFCWLFKIGCISCWCLSFVVECWLCVACCLHVVCCRLSFACCVLYKCSLFWCALFVGC